MFQVWRSSGIPKIKAVLIRTRRAIPRRSRDHFCADIAEWRMKLPQRGFFLVVEKFRRAPSVASQQGDAPGKFMTSGTVKSFCPSKRYGFVQSDADGRDVFVHLSALRQAGLASLRKGQKISFEIYDNRGRAAAKNVRLKTATKAASERAVAPSQSAPVETGESEMKFTMAKKNNLKRTRIARAALEKALAGKIRASDQQCAAFLEVFLERVVPASPGGANWAIKGVKYGKAERNKCNAAIAHCVEESQLEFEISD